MGKSLVKFNDWRQRGHSACTKHTSVTPLKPRYSKQGRTLSLPQLYMQFQSKICPHSVTQVAVRSSRQSVHVLPALTDAGTVSRSRTVSFSFSSPEARSVSGS